MKHRGSIRQIAALTAGAALLVLGAVGQTGGGGQALPMLCYATGVLCLAVGIQGSVRKQTCLRCGATLRTPRDQLPEDPEQYLCPNCGSTVRPRR